MFKSRMRLLAVLFSFIFFQQSLGAFTIKLASPLPEGTEWDNSLRQMADEWSEITGGRVRVKIYPGGIAGDEADMVRKMRIGQIDAGVFSAFGLKMMVPETFVLTLPGLLKSDAEIDYVLEKFSLRFDEKFREAGFEMLSWSLSGWANIFSRVPVHTPAELQSVSLAVDNSETETSAAFKALGFNVVTINLNEIMVGLQSGLVGAVAAPPVLAGAYQWFALAPYMTDFNITPVLGGLVVSERTWQRIPAEYRDELKASMARVGDEFYDEAFSLNKMALSVMDDNGLKHVTLDDEEIEAFEKIMKEGHVFMVGEDKAISPELYKEMQDELENFRMNND